MNPTVAVIIVTWNAEKFIEPCLAALLAQAYEPLRVIVVDNGSTDGSAALVEPFAPTVRLIQNQQNLGFAGGNNVGIRQIIEGTALRDASAVDIVILLNPDTVVQPGWLAAIVETFDRDPSIGIVGCKALYPDGETIQHAGGQIKPDGSSMHWGQGEKDVGQFDEFVDRDYVTGAAMAIQRRVLDRLGPLDAGYHPAFYEETDYCFRTRRAGFRVVYQPRAILLHHESPLIANLGYRQHEMFQRNRLRFVMLHWEAEQLFELLDGDREVLESALAIDFVTAHGAAYWATLCAFPALMQQRAEDDTLAAALAPETRSLLCARLLSLRQLTQQRIVTLFNSLPIDVVPTTDLLLPSAAIAAAADPDSQAAEMLATMAESHRLTEYEFRSDIPLVGGLLTRLRSFWAAIAARWMVRALQYEQSRFNLQTVNALNLLLEQQQTQWRTIAQLAQITEMTGDDNIALLKALWAASNRPDDARK